MLANMKSIRSAKDWLTDGHEDLQHPALDAGERHASERRQSLLVRAREPVGGLVVRKGHRTVQHVVVIWGGRALERSRRGADGGLSRVGE